MALIGKFSHFQFFDIFQQVHVYLEIIDLCAFRLEIIHVSLKERLCIPVPFDLTAQF